MFPLRIVAASCTHRADGSWGYQIKSSETSPFTYSRDMLAAHLLAAHIRQFSVVLQAIRDWKFVPDASILGYFPPQACLMPIAEPVLVIDEVASDRTTVGE